MRGAAILLALSLAVPLAAGAVRAEEADATAPVEALDDAAEFAPAAVSAEDRRTLATCLRDAADLPRACIGSIAVVCARRTPGTSAQAGLDVGCSRREAGVWRERLDLVGGVLAARLDSGPRSRLAAAQRSWETYAVQKCAFAAEMQQPDRAATMQSACALREVATRAIELERLARANTRRPAQPPRIER